MATAVKENEVVETSFVVSRGDGEARRGARGASGTAVTIRHST